MPNHNQQRERNGQPTGRIPTAVYVLTGCVGVFGSNSLVLAPIAPELARSLHSSVSTVMIATALFGLGTAASALWLARHIDRVGAWRVLQIAVSVLAVALVGSALAPHVTVLIVSQLVAGVATGVALPAIYSTAAALAPRGRDSQTIGIVLTGWTLSLVLGVSLSAVVADLVHWRAVYAIVAALALVALVLLVRSAHPSVAAIGPAPMPLEALKIEGVAPLLLACGAFSTAFYGVYGYLGDHLHHGLGRSVSANGLTALIYGIGFGTAVFLDHVVDRVDARRLLPAALVAVSTVYVGLALVSGSFAGVLAAVAIWGLANHFALNALIMRLTASDPARRGTIMGLNSAVTYLAVFIGTTAFGPLYAARGFATLAFGAAALSLLASAIVAWRPLARTAWSRPTGGRQLRWPAAAKLIFRVW